MISISKQGYSLLSCRTFNGIGTQFLRKVTTASLAALLALLNHASQGQETGIISNNDGSAKINASKPHTYASVFLDTDLYSGRYTMNVASTDQGKIADLYMAATVANDWYLKDSEGWRLWNPETEPLVPFAQVTLADEIEMPIIDRQALSAGGYEVFAGYQVAGNAMVLAPQSLQFQIKRADSDTLYAFTSDSAFESFIKQGLQASTTNQELYVLATSAEDSGSTAAAPASNRVSTTNLQESDVDEADSVKTDGNILYTFRYCEGRSCLVSYKLDSAQAQATELGNTQLSGTQTADGMYLVKNRPAGNDLLIAVAGKNGNSYLWRDVWNWQSNETQLEFFDASNPQELNSIEALRIDGQLVSSRRIGETLYVVTRFTPSIPEYQPYPADEEVMQQNESLLASTQLTNLIPKATDSKKISRDLIESQNCYLPTKSIDNNQNPTIITITSIPLGAPTDFKSSCFVGSTETIYMTANSLYLATTQNSYNAFVADSLFYSPEHRTAIHKFSLTQDAINYKGSGQVPGHLGWSEGKKPFRMGENGDYLNIATSVGSTWGASSSTTLTVLKESTIEGELATVNSIEGIGKPGERLYAARFLGDRSYLVTFRLTDPFYVVDLSDQEQPKLVGELEIEGYSDYLHPISEDLILGIGKDAVADDSSEDFGGGRGAWYQGLKLALFDVSNPALPTEVNTLSLGKRGTDSEVLRDHHALSFLAATSTQAARLAIPVRLHETVPERESFDASKPNAFYDFTHNGLYSFEITESGISQNGFLLGSDPDNGFNFGGYSDRSILADDSVFYIHQGEVLGSQWGSTSITE
ncbi:MAG: beta-propeller domain-containing protein [Pseudohongiellaceae bacterium]